MLDQANNFLFTPFPEFGGGVLSRRAAERAGVCAKTSAIAAAAVKIIAAAAEQLRNITIAAAAVKIIAAAAAALHACYAKSAPNLEAFICLLRLSPYN